ncbi:hypothetical protein IAT38_003043 [Cryptococcus sp. DSM 104549]
MGQPSPTSIARLPGSPSVTASVGAVDRSDGGDDSGDGFGGVGEGAGNDNLVTELGIGELAGVKDSFPTLGDEAAGTDGEDEAAVDADLQRARSLAQHRLSPSDRRHDSASGSISGDRGPEIFPRSYHHTSSYLDQEELDDLARQDREGITAANVVTEANDDFIRRWEGDEDEAVELHSNSAMMGGFEEAGRMGRWDSGGQEVFQLFPADIAPHAGYQPMHLPGAVGSPFHTHYPSDRNGPPPRQFPFPQPPSYNPPLPPPPPPQSFNTFHSPPPPQSHNTFPTQGPHPPPSGDTVIQITRHLESLGSLLHPLIERGEEVDRLRKEAEIWKAAWGEEERKRRVLEGKVAEAEARREGTWARVGPKFSAVLLDGDGLIFQSGYIRAGEQGGKLAAQHLLSALPTLLAALPSKSRSPTHNEPSEKVGKEITLDVDGRVTDTAGVPVQPGGEVEKGPEGAEGQGKRELESAIVQVFINKSGLGGALLKAGAITSWNEYDRFWHGFSGAHELFTVVDVGPGKEAADAKIREYLKLYAKNAQCEMIVLGASHDNGYANVLASLQTESRIANILLLKGYTDLAAQLKAYSARVVSIPGLFRTTRLSGPSIPAQGVNAPGAGNGSTATAGQAETGPGGKGGDATAGGAVEAGRGKYSAIVASSPKQLAPASSTAAARKPPALVPGYASTVEDSSDVNSEFGGAEVFEWDGGAGFASVGAVSVSTGATRGVGGRSVPGSSTAKQDWASGRKFRIPPSPPPSASAISPSPAVATPSSGPSAGFGVRVPGAGGGVEEGEEEWIESPARRKAKGKKEKMVRKGEAADLVRSMVPRPCHTHYLGQRDCRNGANCQYSHRYVLNDAQLEELARLAKTMVCPRVKEGRCRFSDEECVYGHHCPNPKSCVFGETCRFYDVPNGHEELE